MSVSLSQLNQSPYLVAPAQPASFVLLGLYVVIIGLMAYRRRDELGMWGPGRWVATLFLFVLAPIFSTSLAIELSGVDLPAPTIVPVEPAAPAIAVPAFVPVVLAAGWLGVIPTLVVGAAGGITRAVFGTNRLFTFFEWMLAAGLLAIFIRQNYRGRLMGMLRHPLGAATASAVFVSIAAFVTFLVDGSGAGLSGLEAIGVQWQGNGLPLVVELLVAGVVGEAARLGLARWWVHPDIQRPPPYAVSLNNRILYTLVPVIGAGIVILTIASQNIAASVATNIVVDQMERDAQNAASGIPFFVRTGESLIRDLARDERLQTMDVEARNRQLATGIRTVPYFDQLVYFDVLAAPAAAYPQLDVTGLGLTRAELEAVELALEGVLRSVTVYPQGDENVVQIAYIAPVEDAGSGAVVGALLGRTNLEANPLMEPVINNLQGLLVGSGAGFITDENNRIIYHPDPYRLGDVWLPLEADDVLDTDVEDGRAYRDRTATGAPQLVYYLPAAGHPWQVVIIVPNEAVGLQAAQITVPLFLILVGIAVVGLVALFFASARITHPLKKLTDATSAFARGEMDVPVAVSGDDEVGQLGAAYERMRLRLRARLEELRMLLGVSQAVAGSLDLEHSIPPILEAAQYVVDASGVRLVLKAGSEPGEPPKTFVRGTAAPTMAALDEDLLSLVETEGRLAIDNLARAKAVLEVSRVLPEVQSLIALPLRHKASFLGTLWLGYEYPRRFVNNEQSFLETLASQAAVAIANAHLYEASEGGRQRLQAILSSTPDAVIVTDERNRLLLINPAAQSIFEIDGAALYGKRIDKVFRRRDVIALLGDDEESSQPHELSLPDGRTLYATAFRLRLDDGSDIGRVAVMRDVTHFKELD
ncbi:MAG: HAMP domain-containing protein, partial [Anaerolineales bacterium]